MDSRLLKECEIAREELRRGKKDMATARAEYEESIRRLYLGGASLGKIGEALGISRQRVHQIIGAVPQPLERRAHGLRHEPGHSCSFCGRSAKFAGKLVAGLDSHICNECIGAASRLLANKASERDAHFARLPNNSRKPCSFCGQKKEGLARVAASGHQICRNCVALVNDADATPAE